METAFHNILSGKGRPGEVGTGIETALGVVSSQETSLGAWLYWMGAGLESCSPGWGEVGICTPGTVCLLGEQLPH